MAAIEGRNIKLPNYDLTHTAGGVMLRVGDDANPAFWIHVTITWEEIDRLIADRLRGEGLAAMLIEATAPGRELVPGLVDLCAPPMIPEFVPSFLPPIPDLPEIPPPPQ